jgi:hypothetical protein
MERVTVPNGGAKTPIYFQFPILLLALWHFLNTPGQLQRRRRPPLLLLMVWCCEIDFLYISLSNKSEEVCPSTQCRCAVETWGEFAIDLVLAC